MTFAYNPIQQSIDTLVNAFIAHARTVDSLTCPLEHMPLSLPSFKSTHIFTARGPMRCGMTHYLLDLFHRSESCFFISPNGRALDIPITARQRVFQVENPAGYGRVLRTLYQLENKPQLVLIDNYLDLCGKDSALENLADAMYDEPQARNQFIIGLSTR